MNQNLLHKSAGCTWRRTNRNGGELRLFEFKNDIIGESKRNLLKTRESLRAFKAYRCEELEVDGKKQSAEERFIHFFPLSRYSTKEQLYGDLKMIDKMPCVTFNVALNSKKECNSLSDGQCSELGRSRHLPRITVFSRPSYSLQSIPVLSEKEKDKGIRKLDVFGGLEDLGIISVSSSPFQILLA